MTKNYGAAGQGGKDRETERSRGAGMNSAAAKKGKFHVSV